jgi:hypothetical protein
MMRQTAYSLIRERQLLDYLVEVTIRLASAIASGETRPRNPWTIVSTRSPMETINTTLSQFLVVSDSDSVKLYS